MVDLPRSLVGLIDYQCSYFLLLQILALLPRSAAAFYFQLSPRLVVFKWIFLVYVFQQFHVQFEPLVAFQRIF